MGITSNENWRAMTPNRLGITAAPKPLAVICMPMVLAAKCTPPRWLVPDIKADLVAYVLDRAIDGMFLYLGREEARIREDPLARTSEILRRVFGNG